ncbi:MFS transporter [Leifsonia sp. NPDC080035]|uniref:MFS transporter n=1 Tax=Leifsonia sp. NPDC080035 TaxID=3143936 RepID=A0AAU7G7D0_9MICO
MTASTATLRSSGARRRGGTPLLLALGLTLFASVSTELLPPALILGMSSTLGVDAAAVGALVTVWAVTIVVCTVPAVRLTRRLPRRALLTASLLLFAAATLVVALVPSFAVVVAARIVSALAAAVSWSVVFAYVPRLVPEERLGRAMAIVLGGGTLASVLGVPIGAALAAAGGWQWAFLGAAVLLALSAAALARGLPALDPPGDDGRSRRGIDRSAIPVGALLGAGALLLTGYMTVYAFIVPVLGAAGVRPVQASAVLLAAGIAGAVALVAGGALGDRFPDGTLLVLVATIAAGAVLLAVATSPGAAIAGAVALGFGIGGLPPVFQARIARTASPAFRDLAVSLFVVILNVGIAAGSATGAAILGTGGLGTLAVVASALAVAALLAFALTLAVTRQTSRRQRP